MRVLREGLIKTEADLAMLDFPDPHDDALYAGAEEYVKHKGVYAVFFQTRIGAFAAMLSMGIDGFCLALYENRKLVETIVDRYCDWAAMIAERVSQMGFDAYVSTDDLGHKSAPFVSPALFRKLLLPRFQRVAEKIRIPWIMHIDGNITPNLDDLIALGIAGLHPIEKGAMDIAWVKHNYGQQIYLLGNVDLNLLSLGTPGEVTAAVRNLIRMAGQGGGYIVTCGNGLTTYCRPENVIALSEAVQKYGSYPIRV